MSDPESKDDQGYGREQVVKIINSVLSRVESGQEGRLSIFRELKTLQKIIEDTRSELGAARATDIKNKHIPTATDELDAVVAATAEATGTIMDSCDVISEKAGIIGGETGDALVAEVTKIYEACSFQDITGQRIKKVVSTLCTIEDKVSALISVLSDKLPVEETGGEEGDTRVGDARLLNGPQMADKAISQDDIDKLLEDFG
jgi:chemotaxis protein CheZ